MNAVKSLIQEVKSARHDYLALISTVSETQAAHKQTPEVWNVTENTEHLYWAEHGSVLGMWKLYMLSGQGNMKRSLTPILITFQFKRSSIGHGNQKKLFHLLLRHVWVAR